jgi:hypothetical protein
MLVESAPRATFLVTAEGDARPATSPIATGRQGVVRLWDAVPSRPIRFLTKLSTLPEGTRAMIPTIWGNTSRCLVVLSLIVFVSAANRGPIRQLRLDPAVEVIPLFTGVDSGAFTMRIAPTGPELSHVIVTNVTEEPLTVGFPKAAIGAQVLPQLGNGFGQNNAGGFGQGASGQQGQAQDVGGTFQGANQGQNGLQNQAGNNLFAPGFPSLPPEWDAADYADYGGLATIPAGASILVQLKTVCLDYGAPDPQPNMTYRLLPIDQYTQDRHLIALLESYSERVPPNAMQAAAWHVANGLTWSQLAQLPQRSLAGIVAPVFQTRDLQLAQRLVTETRPQEPNVVIPTASR